MACRDRFLQPFASNSIWNTAIGDDAVFEHVHLYDANYTTCGGTGTTCSAFESIHNDQDFFLMADESTPLGEFSSSFSDDVFVCLFVCSHVEIAEI
jgi:hypothetical protein